MAKRTINNLKLGVFVLSGLAVLVMMLYIIGKNEFLFGNTFMLKARFENVHGLMPGNNIRFAGINAGTVKDIRVINDTTIEVTLFIRKDMRRYILKNARISIGTDGLMGNKLLNIESARMPAPPVNEGDILYSAAGVDTDQMLKTLNTTSQDIAVIAAELRKSVHRLNASNGLWRLLEDETIPYGFRQSLARVHESGIQLQQMTTTLNMMASDLSRGKGTLGELLRDTAISSGVRQAVQAFTRAGAGADSLSSQINAMVQSIGNQIDTGRGAAHILLKDTLFSARLASTLQQIEEGSRAFNRNMEALKNNFLLRGYFRRQNSQQKSL